MRINLKWKIIGLVGLPLAVSLIFGSIYLMSNWRILQTASGIVENGKFIEVNSELIHQIQIERAKTALFLGAKVALADLEKQHQVVQENGTWLPLSFRRFTPTKPLTSNCKISKTD